MFVLSKFHCLKKYLDFLFQKREMELKHLVQLTEIVLDFKEIVLEKIVSESFNTGKFVSEVITTENFTSMQWSREKLS